MRIIGFNFTKIAGERFPNFKRGPINTNIEFKELEKDKVDMFKDENAIKLAYTLDILYEEEKEKEKETKNPTQHGKISFDGNLILSVTKEESKNLQKSWKKKQLPPELQIPLYNFILKKSSPKALIIQDDLNLPSHIPIPQITPKQDQPQN
tara:strand:+ start:636 stop:1088 length:453 start_codon:yes stop_codon:yes gene_type:complete